MHRKLSSEKKIQVKNKIEVKSVRTLKKDVVDFKETKIARLIFEFDIKVDPYSSDADSFANIVLKIMQSSLLI